MRIRIRISVIHIPSHIHIERIIRITRIARNYNRIPRYVWM